MAVLQAFEGQTTVQFVDFEMITCYNCSMPFLVPGYFRKIRRDDHKSFWCPNGHEQHYTGKSEAEKLKEEMERIQKRNDDEQTRLYKMYDDERKKKEKEKRKAKVVAKELQTLQTRVHNGVCPCCNRTFKNLATHMKHKHPDVAPPILVDPIHLKINAKSK